MGSGFTNNPPDEGTPLPPAEDVQPQSFLTGDQLGEGAKGVIDKLSTSGALKDLLTEVGTKGGVGFYVWLSKHAPDLLKLMIEASGPKMLEFGKSLVETYTPLIASFSDIFGGLSGAYTAEVTRHYSANQGGEVQHAGTPAGNAAKYAFDNIVAPIATFTSGADPSQPGAGEKNIQQTLGILVQLHLITWVLNVTSNLTGIGQLKFFNSFTEVLTTALGARRLSRAAMGPYINKFITGPATGDLNEKWPVVEAGASAAIKQYLRGGIDQAALVKRLKRMGFDEEVVAQLLLDTAKLMGVDDVAYLVKQKTWTLEQGEKYLAQLGYDEDAAKVVLFRQINGLVFDNTKRMAEKLGGYFADGQIDDQIYHDTLVAWGFSYEEAQSYVHLYAIDQEFTKPLTLTQVQNLYKEGLVDLNYVRNYLIAQRNSPDDADLLILLLFATKEERDQAKAILAAQARVTAIQRTEAAAVKTANQDAELAQALSALAAAKAALASYYGA